MALKRQSLPSSSCSLTMPFTSVQHPMRYFEFLYFALWPHYLDFSSSTHSCTSKNLVWKMKKTKTLSQMFALCWSSVMPCQKTAWVSLTCCIQSMKNWRETSRQVFKYLLNMNRSNFWISKLAVGTHYGESSLSDNFIGELQKEIEAVKRKYEQYKNARPSSRQSSIAILPDDDHGTSIFSASPRSF